MGRALLGVALVCCCGASLGSSACESKSADAPDTRTGKDAGVAGSASCAAASADFRTPTVIVAEGNSNPSALYVDDQYVYWSSTADNLSLRRADKNGCENRKIAAWQGGSQPFASDASFTYWLATPDAAAGGNSLIHRVDRKTGAARDFALPAAHLSGSLLASDDAVMLYDLECLSVGQLAKADGNWQGFSLVPPAAPGAGGETVLVSDASNIYCSSAKRVYSVAKSAQPWRTTVLHTSDYPIRGMAADSSSLYWVEHGPAPAEFRPPDQWAQSIYTLPKAGGVAQRLAVLDRAGFGGALLLDAARRTLYWIRQNSAHSDILALPLGSTEVRYIARDRNLRGAIAQDTDYLYFTEDHAITKLRKPELSP